MDTFDLKKFLIENKLTYQETMKQEKESLNEGNKYTIEYESGASQYSYDDIARLIKQTVALEKFLKGLFRVSYMNIKDEEGNSVGMGGAKDLENLLKKLRKHEGLI